MVKIRRRVGASLLGLIVATGLAASVLPTASAADYVDSSTVKNSPVTLETGHIDAFNLISTGKNQIRMVLKEDVTGSGVLREPESVTLKVKEQAKMTLPDAAKPAYQDIINDGLTNSFYYLPLTQDQNLIWPGWDSMGAAPALGIGNLNDASCDNVIEKVQAPAGGKVLMWSINDWGSPASVMANSKYALPNTIVQPILAHQHINWAFTKAGTYKLTVHSKVTRAADKFSLTSESHVFTFVVGDVPKADKTTLKGTIEAADYMQESDYTADSWAPFAKALADAKKIQADGNATQQAVDDAVSTLNDAWDALEEATPPVDWTALDAAIASAGKLKQPDYTAQSWAPFAEALINAKGIRNNPAAAQGDADNVTSILADAQKALVKVAPAPAKADKTALDKAVTAASALKQSDYTADSWAPFAKAFADAKSVQADAKATQQVVDAAAAALTDTQKGLKKPAPVIDWSKLDVAIAAAAPLKQSDYTADSWTPFADALTAAKSVRANTKAAQAEVDSAVSALAAAQAKLVKVSVNPQPTKADKTALNAAIDAAAKHQESAYTADSWKPFADSLTGARAVRANAEAAQADVNAAVAALSKAQTALAKAAPSTPTKPTKPTKPSKPAPVSPAAPNKQTPTTPTNPKQQAPNKQTPTNPGAANNKLAATGSSIEPVAALLALFALAGIALVVLRNTRRND
ncbi:choice-of-anchor M domain-containing protein [Bifidobacterium tibiigranuli]|uniref:choice-of-anchor M domain-containing protein n=1 Tax=Bifidobacterium tibiigranuli TaxID=2172043 RepID=UPI0026ECA3F6|nr:choice-of-anchor M domain-containing protein [Bifidobacterium tibiigranuli]MCI1223405.1 choice-of-anchor M domain-containing protein [Bifidobacterium subtile]MCI1650256.1 choice-of-anchor M domain-containing protein [Bifidobacterium tibiigranuli]MCI2184820.1 choice-of-anchor M domain-containing protein [Bifidobacterium tibiigranuli]MCI2204389.1 choice-of-anchor M domain-containing protein [Bifidobacterium tibiigranuli]